MQQRRTALELGILAAIVLLAGAYRLSFVSVPLDRDEGEYAYAGQLLQEGVPPYEAAYNMKMPGTYVAYAIALTVFGPTEQGIRFALLIVNASTIWLVWLLARRFFGSPAALAAAFTFAVMSLGTPVRGIYGKAEHFVVLAAVAGMVVLSDAMERERGRLPRLAISGILFGMAFLAKQHGLFFAAFGVAWVGWVELRRRPVDRGRAAVRVGMIAVATLVPFFAVVGWLASAGVLESFRYWTFTYAFEYTTSIPLGGGLELLRERVGALVIGYVPVVALMVLGLVVLLRKRRGEPSTGFVLLLCVFSFLAVCPGLYFRAHYFQMLLPAVALLAGIGFETIVNASPRRSRAAASILVLVVLAQTVHRERDLLTAVARDPGDVSRLVYHANPFREAREIGRYLREHSQPEDRVAVLGSEPQIYFYADRRSVTGYMYTYALVESHGLAGDMQQDLIDEVEAGEPRFLVFVKVPESWIARRGFDERIFDWFREYSKDHYDLVGVADIPEQGETVYRFDEAAAGYTPRQPRWIVVLRRR